MSVTENDRVEGPWVGEARIPIALTECLEPLEEPAVEQQAVVTGGDEVHGARHSARRAEKLNGRQIPSPELDEGI